LRRFPIIAEDGMSGTDYGFADTALISNLNKHTLSKAMDYVSGGTDLGEKIIITGLGNDHVYETAEYLDGKNPGTIYVSPKWLVYDRRLINLAYENHNSATYKVYTTTEFENNFGTKTDPILDAQFEEITDGSTKKYGVYNAGTMAKYFFSKNMYVYYNYPAFRTTQTNHRAGIYCGSIADLRQTTSSPGTKYIGGNGKDTNPRVLEQAGIGFLVCDNPKEGFHAYKTYGLKQDADYWGVIDGEDNPSGAGSKYNEDDLDLTIDGEVYLRSYGGDEAYRDTAKRVKCSNVGGTYFMSAVFPDNTNDVDAVPASGTSYRYIYRLTPGITKPQNFSFYYQFNYLRAPYDVSRYLSLTSNYDPPGTVDGSGVYTPITSYIIDQIAETGYMNLVIKHAPTLEQLYTEPTEEISIPLAYNAQTEPDIIGRYFCHHSFQTDMSNMFFRIESTHLVTPYDRGNGIDYNFTWDPLDETNGWELADPELGLSYTSPSSEETGDVIHDDSHAKYEMYRGTSDPYAEIIVKGLTFSHVDLPTVDEDITGASLLYAFSTTTTAPPASGGIRFNNATFASVTEIYIHETDSGANDQAIILDEIDNNDYVQVMAADSHWARFLVTNTADNGTYRTLTVTPQTSDSYSGIFTNAEAVYFNFSSTDYSGATKTIAVNGIVNSSGSKPKEIIRDGVWVGSNDEIVIDFPSHVYVNELSFNVNVGDYQGVDSNTSFEISYLAQSTINEHNYNVVGDSDWISLSTIGFDPDDYTSDELASGVTVSLDSMKIFAKTIRIYIKTNLEFELRNLIVKSFASVSGSAFTKGGGVKNEEMIILDDVHGLLTGKNATNTDIAAYAEFKSDASYVEMDLGVLTPTVANADGSVPINRISMNVSNGQSRSMKIEIWKHGETDYETDYMYSIVAWTARLHSASDKIDTTILRDAALSNSGLDPYGHADTFNSVIEGNSNYSQHFSNGALRGWVFKPNIKKARNLTILNSETYSGSGSYDGTLSLPSQLDENGPFGSDQGERGSMERIVVAEFPVTKVRKIKVTVYGFDDENLEPIKVNGLKTYSPLVDSDGVAVWPSTATAWNMVLRANTITSL
jgi:hypothetical protein